jgi:hypothetical protein
VVRVIEEDDGSGWVKVDDGAGGKGLVPATYLDMDQDASTPPAMPVPTPAPAPATSARPGSGKYGA